MQISSTKEGLTIKILIQVNDSTFYIFTVVKNVIFSFSDDFELDAKRCRLNCFSFSYKLKWA